MLAQNLVRGRSAQYVYTIGDIPNHREKFAFRKSWYQVSHNDGMAHASISRIVDFEPDGNRSTIEIRTSRRCPELLVTLKTVDELFDKRIVSCVIIVQDMHHQFHVIINTFVE